jgi:hypothetical protein
MKAHRKRSSTLLGPRERKRDWRKRREGGGRNDRNGERIFITHELCICYEWVQCNKSKHQDEHFIQCSASQICEQALKPYSHSRHSIRKSVACLCSTRAASQSRVRYARMGGQTGSTTPFHIYSAIFNEWTTARLHLPAPSSHLTSPAPTREFRWFDWGVWCNVRKTESYRV